MDDYTKKHPLYKLFKLHGSVNWAREVAAPTKAQNPGHAWSVVNDLIERAAEIPITQNYILTQDHPPGVVQLGYGVQDALSGLPARSTPVFPAIAIPVEKKTNFECPDHMWHELITLLPKVSKILVIGWRATEANFLQYLKAHIRPKVQLHIVAGSKAGAEETSNRMHAALPNIWPAAKPDLDPGGFTDFIVSRRAEQFLAS